MPFSFPDISDKSMNSQTTERTVASLCGLGAILLWALLALFTAGTAQVPPFQLTAMTFGTAFVGVSLKWLFYRQDIRPFFKIPMGLWVLGVAGLFGYHFFYFLALKNAPAAEAGLIAYLWPLLIVLFSTLLPGERFYWFHLVGGLISLAGAGLLITKGAALEIRPEYSTGYLAAICCAFIWSSYSVLSRRYSAVSSDVIGLFCGITALLSLGCHLLFEVTLWPEDALQWLAVLGLGLGPVGAAFFLWDRGMKHGDIQTLGVLSYLSPLLSTLILLAVGVASFSWSLLFGCLLITVGALVGSLKILRALWKPAKPD
ncbi:EamA family transporter [Sneathiella sp.]|uniref:aromatic amino acid exporter YddG n=1 Tax=Sneathiella sp. TaxID=1964365 RepID=UPI00262CDCEF|nr:EamA family transporter [Sneathiella sp.]MDF2368894.1 EamA family transporter [Sneathiella sp.]